MEIRGKEIRVDFSITDVNRDPERRPQPPAQRYDDRPRPRYEDRPSYPPAAPRYEERRPRYDDRRDDNYRRDGGRSLPTPEPNSCLAIFNMGIDVDEALLEKKFAKYYWVLIT